MSCNTNQNHLVRNGRPTSRVLAPPGGASSFTLGVAPPPAPKPVVSPPKEEPKKEPKPEVVVALETKQEEKEPPVADEPPAAPSPAEDTTTKANLPTTDLPQANNEAPISANAFVSGSNMNGGCVMTGRPTSRVLAPPGGHSSFKLG